MFIVGPQIWPSPDILLGGVVTFPIKKHGNVTTLPGDFMRDYLTHFERYVVNTMVPLIRGQHKYVECKIRCSFVKRGEFPCEFPGWHMDTVTDSDHPSQHEVHHLYCTPPTTLFWRSNDWASNGGWLASPEISAPENRIISYGRTWHAAPRMPEDGMRLLIRISETDIVKPRRQSEGR